MGSTCQRRDEWRASFEAQGLVGRTEKPDARALEKRRHLSGPQVTWLDGGVPRTPTGSTCLLALWPAIVITQVDALHARGEHLAGGRERHEPFGARDGERGDCGR